jgi:hypothetical protein
MLRGKNKCKTNYITPQPSPQTFFPSSHQAAPPHLMQHSTPVSASFRARRAIISALSPTFQLCRDKFAGSFKLLLSLFFEVVDFFEGFGKGHASGYLIFSWFHLCSPNSALYKLAPGHLVPAGCHVSQCP